MTEKGISVLNVGVTRKGGHPFKSCCTDMEKVAVCSVKDVVSYNKVNGFVSVVPALDMFAS